MPEPPSARFPLDALRRLVARLRAPDGCPWDRKQTLGDVRAFVLEEAHELAAAIDGQVARPAGDESGWQEVAAELGDLLFQVCFVARLGEEAGAFDLDDVAERIHAKMVARHPHVFPPESGERERLPDAAAVASAWERRKAAEGDGDALLAGVPTSLPALVAAYRMTQKAAGVDFDWPDRASVLAKVHEEMEELEEVLDDDEHAIREELGDVLFALANLARHLDLDPEATLAAANLKFRRRFGAVEERLRARGGRLGEASLEELDALWNDVKREE